MSSSPESSPESTSETAADVSAAAGPESDSDRTVRQSSFDLDSGLGALLGLRMDEVRPDRVRASLTIDERHLQPFGIVHGGTYCAIIEQAASIGAAVWFGDRGTVVGVSNQTDFLRALRDGEITALAKPIHQGRSQQLWQVEVTDEQDRLVCRGQVRLQNLSRPAE